MVLTPSTLAASSFCWMQRRAKPVFDWLTQIVISNDANMSAQHRRIEDAAEQVRVAGEYRNIQPHPAAGQGGGGVHDLAQHLGDDQARDAK